MIRIRQSTDDRIDDRAKTAEKKQILTIATQLENLPGLLECLQKCIGKINIEISKVCDIVYFVLSKMVPSSHLQPCPMLDHCPVQHCTPIKPVSLTSKVGILHTCNAI